MEARTKPRLLFYCQHSVGIGHLMRSMLLARRLSERFHVLFLNGGPLPPGVAVPSEVELIDLPPLGMVDGHELISREAHTDLSAAKAQRRALVLEVFRRCAPRALLIELFPFGRKKFAFELLPLLKAARRSTPTPPLTLCSVRDILVAARPDQQHHDDRAAWLCRRYFDAVLVHADPRLARLGESFRPRRALSTPLYYTGFVAPQSQSRAVQRGEHALVSAGGGLVGGPLLRTAIEAHKRLPRTARRAMRVVAGPFLPEGDWRALQVMAHAEPDIELVRSVPALAVEMHQAALSISQCGYNTAMDILVSRTPALVIPYCEAREDEQLNRARRLEGLGFLRMLPPQQLDAEHLARAILAMHDFRSPTRPLDLSGADTTARLIEAMIAQRGADAARGKYRIGREVFPADRSGHGPLPTWRAA